MEYIKELITAYLPTLTSVAAIIISATTFVANVKKLVGNIIEDNKMLKLVISNVEQITNKKMEYLQKEIEEIQQNYTLLLGENKLLRKENVELRKAMAADEELQKTIELLRLQIHQLEEKIGE